MQPPRTDAPPPEAEPDAPTPSDTILESIPPAMVGAPRKSIPRLGSVIGGRYLLGRLLGSGATSAVFEAIDQTTGGKLAVKVLHDRNAASQEHVARFLREARIAERIDHPGAVKIVDSGRDDDERFFIALELLDGEDMSVAMERGPLPLDTVVEIARQVLAVLAVAHERGIVHRDVKPENVFLARTADASIRVKLIDFGIAKTTGARVKHSIETLGGTTLGTPHYMSPEQCRGSAVGAPADVWSVGAVIFHALAGQPPHDDAQIGRLLQKIVSVPAPRLRTLRPDVSPALDAVIARSLAIDVPERFPTARAMRAALARAMNEPPAAAD